MVAHAELTTTIRQIHAASRGTYGLLRVTAACGSGLAGRSTGSVNAV
jgi:hypothetical protein